MSQDANPGPEDCVPPDEGEDQQSKRDEPTPEDCDPPDESNSQQSKRDGPGPEDDDPTGDGQQSRRIEPGPVDDDPPPPQKHPQASSFFGSLRHMLARFFHRP